MEDYFDSLPDGSVFDGWEPSGNCRRPSLARKVSSVMARFGSTRYITYVALNLEAWRDFRGWDRNGREAGIQASLDLGMRFRIDTLK